MLWFELIGSRFLNIGGLVGCILYSFDWLKPVAHRLRDHGWCIQLRQAASLNLASRRESTEGAELVASNPYTSKYRLRRYLDPPNPPQSHLLRRYDGRPRLWKVLLILFSIILEISQVQEDAPETDSSKLFFAKGPKCCGGLQLGMFVWMPLACVCFFLFFY